MHQDSKSFRRYANCYVELMAMAPARATARGLGRSDDHRIAGRIPCQVVRRQGLEPRTR